MLTMEYNPDANGKIEQGHSLVLTTLVKACDGKVKIWPQLLAYVLWADQTTHKSVTEYMLAKLRTRQTLIMPTETTVTTWGVLPWKEEMS